MISAIGLERLGFVSQVDFICADKGDGVVFIAEWLSSQPQPSEADIEQAHAEWQAEYNANQYARDRATAYPSLQDQADMQYWDAVNGTTTWQDAIAKVKADYPKG